MYLNQLSNNSSPVCVVTGEHRAPARSPGEIHLHPAVLRNVTG